MSTQERPSADECNAVAELRDLVEALKNTHWSSWQSTDKFQDKLTSAEEWLKSYDERKQQ